MKMQGKFRRKSRRKYGLAYRKIILSFAVIVLLITSLNGIITYAFVKVYGDQVRKNRQAELKQIGIQMQQRLFRPANRLYVDFISNPVLYPELKDFFHHSVKTRPSESVLYYRLYSSLHAAVSSMPETFRDVSVYSKTANVVLSTSGGANWLNDTWSDNLSLDGIEQVVHGKSSLFWKYTPIQISSETGKKMEDASIALCGTYPFNAFGEKCKGVFQIRLNTVAISRLLQEYQTQQTSYYLIDKLGRPIASVGKPIDFTNLYQDKLNDIGQSEYIETYKVDGVDSVLVSRPFQEDYILMSVTTLDVFYEQANRVRHMVSLVELSVLLVGFLLAKFFSDRLYRPLRQLIEPAREYSGSVLQEKRRLDEYAYIHEVMENLSSHASSLENMMDENFSLIRDGFLQTLLYEPKLDRNEIREKLDLLHLSFPYPYFCVVGVSVPQKIFRTLQTEQKVVLLYGLLNCYHEYKSSEIVLAGTKNNDRSLTLIVNLPASAKSRQDDWMREISRICFRFCQVPPNLSVSSCVTDILELSEAYQQNSICEPYFFFLTDEPYLKAERILTMECKADSGIPARFPDDFRKHLDSFDEESATVDILKLVEKCKSGQYTAAHCRAQLFSAVSALSRFILRIYPGGNHANGKIYDEFFGCTDIDCFQDWICGRIRYYVNLQRQNHAGQYSDILQSMTDYILQHLSESISLEVLADTFHISPNYLSRLFREQVGLNYTEYVNNARLELAAELLINSGKTIERIAGEAGFNSSVYFIKRFKRKYGMTPKTYRMNAMMQESMDS
jgi:AraC-like DNA-binding protein